MLFHLLSSHQSGNKLTDQPLLRTDATNNEWLRLAASCQRGGTDVRRKIHEADEEIKDGE